MQRESSCFARTSDMQIASYSSESFETGTSAPLAISVYHAFAICRRPTDEQRPPWAVLQVGETK